MAAKGLLDSPRRLRSAPRGPRTSSWAVLVAFGAVSRASWAALGASWAVLGASWAVLGIISAPIWGRNWAPEAWKHMCVLMDVVYFRTFSRIHEHPRTPKGKPLFSWGPVPKFEATSAPNQPQTGVRGSPGPRETHKSPRNPSKDPPRTPRNPPRTPPGPTRTPPRAPQSPPGTLQHPPKDSSRPLGASRDAPWSPLGHPRERPGREPSALLDSHGLRRSSQGLTQARPGPPETP